MARAAVEREHARSHRLELPCEQPRIAALIIGLDPADDVAGLQPHTLRQNLPLPAASKNPSAKGLGDQVTRPAWVRLSLLATCSWLAILALRGNARSRCSSRCTRTSSSVRAPRRSTTTNSLEQPRRG